MYQLLLFGHLIGVGLLVLGTGIFLAGTEGLRRARTGEELRATAALTRAGTRVLAPGGLILLSFGVTLAARGWSFTEPWIVTSLVLVAVLGVNGLLTERWLAQIQHAIRFAGDDVPPITRATARHAANRATLAVLAELEFLMTVKPASAMLLTSLLVAATIAAIVAVATSGQARAATG